MINKNLPGSIHLSRHQTILENPGTDVGRRYAMLFHFVIQLVCKKTRKKMILIIEILHIHITMNKSKEYEKCILTFPTAPTIKNRLWSLFLVHKPLDTSTGE